MCANILLFVYLCVTVVKPRPPDGILLRARLNFEACARQLFASISAQNQFRHRHPLPEDHAFPGPVDSTRQDLQDLGSITAF